MSHLVDAIKKMEGGKGPLGDALEEIEDDIEVLSHRKPENAAGEPPEDQVVLDTYGLAIPEAHIGKNASAARSEKKDSGEKKKKSGIHYDSVAVPEIRIKKV